MSPFDLFLGLMEQKTLETLETLIDGLSREDYGAPAIAAIARYRREGLPKDMERIENELSRIHERGCALTKLRMQLNSIPSVGEEQDPENNDGESNEEDSKETRYVLVADFMKEYINREGKSDVPLDLVSDYLASKTGLTVGSAKSWLYRVRNFECCPWDSFKGSHIGFK